MFSECLGEGEDPAIFFFFYKAAQLSPSRGGRSRSAHSGQLSDGIMGRHREGPCSARERGTVRALSNEFQMDLGPQFSQIDTATDTLYSARGSDQDSL